MLSHGAHIALSVFVSISAQVYQTARGAPFVAVRPPSHQHDDYVSHAVRETMHSYSPAAPSVARSSLSPRGTPPLRSSTDAEFDAFRIVHDDYLMGTPGADRQ
jgi:hypothetical protein